MSYLMIDNLFVREVLSHDEAVELASLVNRSMRNGEVDLKHPAFLVFMDNFKGLKGDIVTYSVPFMLHASWLTTDYFQWLAKEYRLYLGSSVGDEPDEK